VHLEDLERREHLEKRVLLFSEDRRFLLAKVGHPCQELPRLGIILATFEHQGLDPPTGRELCPSEFRPPFIEASDHLGKLRGLVFGQAEALLHHPAHLGSNPLLEFGTVLHASTATTRASLGFDRNCRNQADH